MQSLPTLKLAAHFIAGSFLAASPDGGRICLYFADSPVQSYTFGSGRWTKKQADNSRDSLQVVELGSGRSTFQHKFRESVYPASFFADGNRLYAETLSYRESGQVVYDCLVADLENGKVSEEIGPKPRGIGFGRHALWDDAVLTTGVDPSTARAVSLIQTSWRDNSARITVPYATCEREKSGSEYPMYLSADLRTVAYAFDHMIVCRSTSDLGVLWTSKVDSVYLGAPRIGVSADGRYVVTAVTDNLFSNLESNFYVARYDGKTGRELQRLAVSGTDGVAVSPDGSLIAAAHVVKTQNGSLPTVFLIDTSTGRKVAAVTHDLVRVNPFMNAGFEIHGVEFTSDGRFLITATHDTRVWDLSGL